MFSSTALAESPTDTGDILWLFEGQESAHTDQILAGIEEALAAERSSHLLGIDDLNDRVETRSLSLSGCAFGIETCGSAEAMVFDGLELGLLMRLGIDERGGQYKINYEMVDRRGEVTSSGMVEANQGRQAGFELVRQVFDAVGVVSFESTPAEAAVYVDDEYLGQAPMSEQFGVGTYEYRFESVGYETTVGSFEVRTGEAHRVSAELDELPGRIRVAGAPEHANLWIEDVDYGRATEVIELEAGRHLIEVRADGHETYRGSVQIEPAATTDVEVAMAPTLAILRDVEASEIAAHRFQFEVGTQIGAQMARFPDARGLVDGQEVTFGGWLEDDQLAEGGTARRFVSPMGIRLGINWEGKYVGLGLLSLSYGGESVERPMRLSFEPDSHTERATMERMRILQLRPMQGRVRMFYRNLAPYAQGGLGVSFESMDLRIDNEDQEFVRLTQARAFGSLEVGVRYHFDPRWSVGGSYRLHHYFGADVGLEHTVGLMFGVGLREIPGLESRPPGEL